MRQLLETRHMELGFAAVTFASENVSTPTDWRIEQDRLTLIVHLRGSMQRLETRVQAGPVSRRPARPGEIWLIPAGAHYTGHAQGGQIRYAELSLDPRWLASLVPASGAAAACRLQPLLQRPDPVLCAMIMQLDQLSADHDALAGMMRETLLRLIGLHLLRHYADRPASAGERTSTQRPFPPALRARVVDYVEAHLDQPISLSDLAQLCGVSAGRVIEGFHAGFGTTPAQYVIDRRLHRASLLLGDARRSITQVALDSGFSSHSHLSSMFRQRYGVTPSRYRGDLRQEAECVPAP